MTIRAMNMDFGTVVVRRGFDEQADRVQEIARQASDRASRVASSASRKINSIPEVQSLRTGSIDGISRNNVSVKDKALAIVATGGLGALLSALAFLI